MKTVNNASVLRPVINFDEFAALAAAAGDKKRKPVFYFLDILVWGNGAPTADADWDPDGFFVEDLADDGEPVIRRYAGAPTTFRYCYATFAEAHAAMMEQVGLRDIMGFDIVSITADRIQTDIRSYLEYWKFDADGRELDRSVGSRIIEPHRETENLYLGRTPEQTKFAPGDIVQFTWPAYARPDEECYQALGVVVSAPDSLRSCYDMAKWMVTEDGLGLEPESLEDYRPRQNYLLAVAPATEGASGLILANPIDVRVPSEEVTPELQQLLDGYYRSSCNHNA